MDDKQFFKKFKGCRLEAEVPPAHKARFEEQYYRTTGRNPVEGPAYQTQSNKWGLEARIYFNGSVVLLDELADRGYLTTETATYRGEYAHRINSVDLFWDLVSAGYRLGENT
jgi:hypothetical protein